MDSKVNKYVKIFKSTANDEPLAASS